jgi:hypothetical protein
VKGRKPRRNPSKQTIVQILGTLKIGDLCRGGERRLICGKHDEPPCADTPEVYQAYTGCKIPKLRLLPPLVGLSSSRGGGVKLGRAKGVIRVRVKLEGAKDVIRVRVKLEGAKDAIRALGIGDLCRGGE